jgi:hypothetical protein
MWSWADLPAKLSYILVCVPFVLARYAKETTARPTPTIRAGFVAGIRSCPGGTGVGGYGDAL